MFSLALIALLPLALAKPIASTTTNATTHVMPTSTSTSMSPFATTTDWPSVPKGAVYYDPPANTGRGRRIHPLGRSDLCVTVQPEDNEIKSGASVAVSYCHSNDSPYSEFELWTLYGDVQFVNHTITLGNSTQVLDAVNGKLVLNEVGIHPEGQNWSYSVKGYYSVDGKCLTFEKDSKANCELPWGKVRDLKADKCVGDAPDQVFYVLPYEADLVAQ